MSSTLTQSVTHEFSERGALAKHVHHYHNRQTQTDMAVAVSEAIAKKHNLILEAGTGVGKTFAYLIPALLSGKQVVISTGSKNLQEQLFLKDLPALLTMLDIHVPVALLKGRNNYLCQLRLEKQMQMANKFTEFYIDDLLKINQWAHLSKDGDIGNLTSVAEHSEVIPTVVSTKESCTGKKCDHYDVCFTRKARIKAMDAKVVVVNHHLFFADRLLKDSGFAELLPDPDVVIFDEAHLVPDICISYFGSHISSREIDKRLNAVIKLHKEVIRDSIQLEQLAQRGLIALSEWHNLMFEHQVSDWRKVLAHKTLASTSWSLHQALVDLANNMQYHLGRDDQLDIAFEQLQALAETLRHYFECQDLQAAYSVELGPRFIMLRMSPINVAKQCQQLFVKDTRWIFTSATLQVNRSLAHFAKELGLADSKQLILDSPFDYPNQAVFCVPRHLGKVGQSQHSAKQLVDVCVQAINAAQGRTFILFTSHHMLQQVAVMLQGKVKYPLLVQGQASKQSLLNKFRQLGNAVLLGTSSFWEGVDVRGKLLSCVIIDKLPFVSPDDALYKARAANAERQGLDPFATISLPQAVISLKQGVGRLIRDEKDRGVLILCDNRIVNRAYGQAFINSLPPMQRTRDLEHALQFLKQIP
ncbi:MULTISPECIES: ATP-dependent DNA helicase [Shewanella]|uniref:ATP-dependent DNA helicase n=1 Tax=Shewanella psychromarinicola TaxID=2487742 RepID=A0A3N4E899_9GAMM|nr:ATP-dependent DNA helicase [Shewanella psychromarinicola]AZG36592.1 ATP-dependent DNA helicase [Shewanella psychromarinicola]MCL1083246.1 ATP-dependent DNA helicase [Shewanella psychromarinicola]RPA34439.1 ATP-dependent DNA helicase [Shewanella psychromarinicola]